MFSLRPVASNATSKVTNFWPWPVVWTPSVCMSLTTVQLSLVVYISVSHWSCEKLYPILTTCFLHKKLGNGTNISPASVVQILTHLSQPPHLIQKQIHFSTVSKIHRGSDHCSLLPLPSQPKSPSSLAPTLGNCLLTNSLASTHTTLQFILQTAGRIILYKSKQNHVTPPFITLQRLHTTFRAKPSQFTAFYTAQGIISFQSPSCFLCSRHTGFLAVPYIRQAHCQAYGDCSLDQECSFPREHLAVVLSLPSVRTLLKCNLIRKAFSDVLKITLTHYLLLSLTYYLISSWHLALWNYITCLFV